MEGDVRVRPRRSFRRCGQATLEFAFSAPLLLLCLFAAVDAATWAVENSAAVAAVEEGARLAASAPGTPLEQHPPGAAQVTHGVVAQLRSAMFATEVRPWPDDCPASPDVVEAVFGPRVVAVCVHESSSPRCSVAPSPAAPGVPPYCGESPMVTVRVVGFAASLVPPSFGLGWPSGEIPVDLRATTHTLRFAP
jgi:hypothetical protein